MEVAPACTDDELVAGVSREQAIKGGRPWRKRLECKKDSEEEPEIGVKGQVAREEVS